MGVQKELIYGKIVSVIIMKLDEFVNILQKNTPCVIAIDGSSGSGKTTLAAILKENYNALVFHMDDYYLHPSRKTDERMAQPGGNVDYERMLKEVFTHIKDPYIPSHFFNCDTNELEQRPLFKKQNIIVIEGVYSLLPILRPFYDYTIYLNINRKNQHERILKRSNPEILEQFKTEWIPLEDHYLSHFDIKSIADIVLESSLNFREIFVPVVL